MQFLGYNETKKLSIVQFIMRNYWEISTVVCAGQHDVRKQLRGNFHLCQMKLLVLAAPEATGRCNCCICGGGGASTYLTCQKIFFGFIQKEEFGQARKCFPVLDPGRNVFLKSKCGLHIYTVALKHFFTEKNYGTKLKCFVSVWVCQKYT